MSYDSFHECYIIISKLISMLDVSMINSTFHCEKDNDLIGRALLNCS